MTHVMRIVICLPIWFFLSGCDPSPPSASSGGQLVEVEELSAAERTELEDLRAFYLTYVSYVRSADPSIPDPFGWADSKFHLQLPFPESQSRKELEVLKYLVDTMLWSIYALDDAGIEREIDIASVDRFLTNAGAPSLSKLLKDFRARSNEMMR